MVNVKNLVLLWMPDMDESEWIAALRDPDTRERAFREVVLRYQEPLYGHIRRMVGTHADADDVLQNTFVKAWRFIADFKGEAALFTWLYRIATNEALAFLRSRKRLPDFEPPDQIRGQTTDGPDASAIARKLEAALQTLPDKQRQVFDMKYFAELKYEQISEITGTSVGALKASYYHAVKKIEDYLKRH